MFRRQAFWMGCEEGECIWRTNSKNSEDFHIRLKEAVNQAKA